MTLTWQNGRQLASSSDGSTVTNYTYGADGMRMTKKVGSSTTYYQYFNGLLIQEIKGTKILDYSYDANGQIYAVRYRTNANDEGTYYYYAHNTRGDIVGLYNAEGTLHAKYTYDVWGNKLAVTNASGVAITSQTDIANIQPFRYRGYYYDYESGFYYLQSRYYDPVTHRFINADGLVSTGTGVLGYNLFAYCENNPVNCSDYNGEREISALSFREENSLERSMLCQRQTQLITERRNSVTSSTDLKVNVTSVVNKALISYQYSLKNINFYTTILCLPTCLKATIKYTTFISLVNHHCAWDIKREIPWKKTINQFYPSENYTVVYRNHIMSMEDVGNCTYGILGKSLGLSLPELYAGSYCAAGFPITGSELANEMNDWKNIRLGYAF